MKKSITIRPVGEEDYKKIADIEQKSFVNPWTEKSVIDDIKSTLSHYYVAEVDGDIAGFYAFRYVIDEVELLKIAVKKPYRRKKIGYEMMLSLIERAMSLGADKIFLEVRRGNIPAIKLYEKIGFNQIYTRENYYKDGEDAYVMCKKLS